MPKIKRPQSYAEGERGKVSAVGHKPYSPKEIEAVYAKKSPDPRPYDVYGRPTHRSIEHKHRGGHPGLLNEPGVHPLSPINQAPQGPEDQHDPSYHNDVPLKG